ncbi:hypothetical protein Tco_0418762 [Tanacetum coccineum]
MVACLEKTEGNYNFHKIVDFLASSSIHHALTVSPTIYTSYIEQFWNTASSQTVNDVKQINATVDSKAIVVIEASIRSSLLFNDADGTACLTNEVIFQTLALMGYEDSRDSLEGTNRNEGDQVQTSHDSPLLGGHTSDRAEGALNLQELSVLCTNLSNRVLALESIKDAQDAKISALKSRIKKLEKKCKPSISHHRAWLKSVKRLSMKKRFGKQEFVSKQGRKKSKPESTLDDSTIFDDQDHGMEYMETEEAVDEGRKSGETKEVKLTDDTEVVEDTGSGEKGGNAEELVSTARPDIDAARQEDSDVEPRTPPTITSIFDDDDITMVLLSAVGEESAQRAAEIRSRPPTKSQLRNLMMTYLKNMGGYKHSQLKAKTFEEIQAMYERQKKKINDFKPMDSYDAVKDCKKAACEDTSKKEEVLKELDKEKMRSKNERMSKRKKTKSDLKEEEDLKTFLKIVPDKERIIDYEVLEKRFPIINWESKFYHYDRHGAEGIYYRIFRSDGSSRWIKTFSEMVTRFYRLDLVELYNLVMQRFETITPEGVDLVLWGDLRTMFDATIKDELWQNQERWNLKSWNFYENCGVHTLILEDGTKIHMLVERKYPLTKETLERMLSLRLVARTASEDAYTLLKFIQKQIDKYGSHDGGEKDL